MELHENDIGFHVVSHERRRWPRASSLIEKETLKKANVEGMYFIYFIKRWSAEIPPFVILRFDIRYSAVRCLIQAIEASQFNHQEIVPFWRSFIRAPPLAKKTTSLIGSETLILHRNSQSSIFGQSGRGSS